MRATPVIMAGALVAPFLLGSPAHAFVAGTVMVSQHNGAVDNPGCYAPLISATSHTQLKSGIPCRHIGYACTLMMQNPGGTGPGVAGTPSGSADWRLAWEDNVSSSTNPDIYVENIKCPASGLVDVMGQVHYVSIVAHSGATILHGVGNSTDPALWLTGDYVKFGKLDTFGCGPKGTAATHTLCPVQTMGEGIRIGELNGVRHKDITVYYNTEILSTWSIGLHVISIDGYEGNNSAIIRAGADGSPCIKAENSTMVHFDSDNTQYCGTNVGIPAVPTNALEIWNSAGSTVGPSMSHATPDYVKSDLLLMNSPNSSVSNNLQPYHCVVTPASDLPTDVVSPAGNCIGQ